MFEILLLSFIVTIPIIIEIFLIYDRHRIDLLSKTLTDILMKRNQKKCLDMLLFTSNDDSFPNLRHVLNPMEAFNLNLLFIISIFVDLLEDSYKPTTSFNIKKFIY